MKTEELLKEWVLARKCCERASVELLSCENERKEAENKLGRWLSPDDARLDEPFNLWHGSGVLEVKMIQALGENSKFSIRWRKEPDGKDRHETEW